MSITGVFFFQPFQYATNLTAAFLSFLPGGSVMQRTRTAAVLNWWSQDPHFFFPYHEAATQIYSTIIKNAIPLSLIFIK